MLNFLYKTVAGRLILKILTRPTISRAAGYFMDSKPSSLFIKFFIWKNNINLNDFEIEKWTSFNHFFTRRVKSSARDFSSDKSDFISPCDGLLTAYNITKDLTFNVKNSRYNICSLLENSELAESYQNGTCLVFRLTPSHYHRYHYFDNGQKGENIKIHGILHTVQPIAIESLPVYVQNSREYCILNTENFGDVVFMEVGAMLVGRIVNYHQSHSFKRGDEKGKFEFGGSTIILLFQKGKLELNKKIIATSLTGREFPVKAGEKIGKAL